LNPFPNYYVLGKNLQYFAEHGTSGVFEEGPGINAGDGTDLEELKDFVMAELLWNASLNPDELIAEFLRGYYGSVAEKFIRLCVTCRPAQYQYLSISQVVQRLLYTVADGAWSCCGSLHAGTWIRCTQQSSKRTIFSRPAACTHQPVSSNRS
jgi:hypothetical protein